MKKPIQIKDELSQNLQKITGENNIEFSKPSDPAHGDLACNIALKLASENKSNPRQEAEEIVEKLELPDEIAKVEVAGPGFINFSYSDAYLLESLKNPDKLTDSKTENGTIVLDYSSVNIAKPLGVHHLLSTVIGQATNNILKAKGYKTIGINYLGDYGTQFGKVIYALKNWSTKEEILNSPNPIRSLLDLYVKFHEEEEKDEQLKGAGQEEFKKLEEGDQENREMWHWIVDLSVNELNKVYDLIGGINFDSYSGEADQEQNLSEILKQGKELGIFTKGNKGAYIADLQEEGIDTPFLVQKSDGATLYSTRDIAAIRDRIQNYDPSEIIYVVGNEQKLHFEQLFATASKFPWFDSDLKCTHLKFGRMSFSDFKMSTRKGNVLYLEDLLNEAIKRALEVIDEKNPTLKNKDEVAKIVGTGSVKYSILNQSPETDIVFSWDKAISFEGNAAPYLQYSYARAASILREAQADFSKLKTDNLDPAEALLIRELIRFPEVITEAADKLKPNTIATYIYELAQTFSSFYTQCPVLTSEGDTKNLRLAIVQAYTGVIKEGLHLLSGIEVPEEM